MEIKSTRCVHTAGANGRIYLATHELQYVHEGKEGLYYFVTRGASVVPPEQKMPDAVVVVPIIMPKQDGEEPMLVLTSEFRPAIGCRMLGFPAGLIDQRDYVNPNDFVSAAIRAAGRELKEETGLEWEHCFLVSPNLYVSAGMTNESIVYVFVRCSGKISTAGNEASEDIKVRPVTHNELRSILHNPASVNTAWSKTAWPVMLALAVVGLDSDAIIKAFGDFSYKIEQ